MSRFSPDSVCVVVPEHITSQVEEGLSVLNLKTGAYYLLDPVGKRIWELLQETRKIREIRDQLLEEFDVAREECERDLHDLLAQMSGIGLVEVTDPTIGKEIPS